MSKIDTSRVKGLTAKKKKKRRGRKSLSIVGNEEISVSPPEVRLGAVEEGAASSVSPGKVGRLVVVLVSVEGGGAVLAGESARLKFMEIYGPFPST